MKALSEFLNESKSFTSNPNIKELEKGLTVRITNNKKNISGPGTFTFGSPSKIGKIVSIDKNEVTVEINKKTITVTAVGSNGNMGGDFEIVNESAKLSDRQLEFKKWPAPKKMSDVSQYLRKIGRVTSLELATEIMDTFVNTWKYKAGVVLTLAQKWSKPSDVDMLRTASKSM